jgi:thioredoxin-related protein
VETYVRGDPDNLAKRYAVRGTPNILFIDSRGKPLCQSFGGFNHREDALDLDRYVQKLAKDETFRQAQRGKKACGRIAMTGEAGAPPVLPTTQ